MQNNARFVPNQAAVPRRKFLRALRSETPEVLRGLRDKVFPIYKTLPATLKAETSRGFKLARLANNFGALFLGEAPLLEDLPLLDLLTYSGLGVHTKAYPKAKALEQALTAWACRYNLKDDWLLDLALQTLYKWDHNENVLRSLQWGSLGYETPPSVITHEEARFEFSNPGWPPGYESWQQFEEGLKHAFDNHLQAYKTRISDLAKQRGFKQPPELRKDVHFQYLAHYQVRGQSPSRIAAEFMRRDASGSKDLDENTIFKAVEKTACLIELTLRPSKKGRTKKS